MGKISSIKVEPIYEENENSLPSSIVPLRNTPHTDEWKEKLSIFQEIQKIAGEESQLDRDVAEMFLNEMMALQEDLFQKSKLLTKEDQMNGKLIARHHSYKNRLEKAYKMFKRGTIEMAKTLKFVSEEDPLDKMDKKIKDKNDFKDACGNASSSGTFTSVINHGRHLRVTVKALHRTAKKALATSVDEALYKEHMRKLQYFAQRLIMLGDQYRLGERLVDAIELAEYQQSEKEKINETVTALEAISRSATYQRRKFKLLHIRHAALTMSTKVLSRLLLPKAGDLPEPQMTIIGEETGLPRPCESDEEVLKATNIKEQAYMTPLDVERQIHYGRPTEDEVGLNGIHIEKDRIINDENMAKTIPNYDNLDKEVQHQIKEAHQYMKHLFESPLSETQARF